MPIDRRELLTGAGTATLAALAPSAAAAAKPRAANPDAALLTGLADAMLRLSPEGATSLGLDKGRHADLRHKLRDRTPAGVAAERRFAETSLAALDKSAARPRTGAARIDYDVTRATMRIAADGFGFGYGDVATFNSGFRNTPYAVAQNVGAYIDVPQFLDTDHVINGPADVESYLERMESYAVQLDGETERVRADAARGVVLPDFALAQTLKQLDIARAGPIEQWGLVTSLAKRGTAIKGDHAARAAAIARDKVAPALNRQIAALEALRGRAVPDSGAWKLPQGDAYYAWALRAATTTTLTPDEVHALGREQLAELHGRMDPILKSLGLRDGSVGARMTELGRDPRFRFSEGDKGRAEILAYLREKLADIHSRMPRAFNTLTRGYLEVTRIPPAAEGGAPGAYGGAGSIDGKQPGRFWINLSTPDRWTRFSLPDLAYHEAIPGHVWQGEYAFRQSLLRTLQGFNAYSEGWALYAEQIADELGVYDDFPAGRLGYLQSLAFRACRMVVDTGIHAKKWTREQGIDFFVTQNGSNPIEVKSEVERYCTWPGQACGYKVGHSTIVRLRDKAKAALGPRYDFKAFNDAVVLGGNVPMTVLASVIDRHIAARRG